MEDIVNLNVGGSLYTTTRSTLTRCSNSMLDDMFSGRLPCTRDANGVYIIDGDGPVFRYVLNYLRRGTLILPEDFKEFELLASEAASYGLGELKRRVDTDQGEQLLERGRHREDLLDTIREQSDGEHFSYIEIQVCVHQSLTYTGGRWPLELLPLLLNFFVTFGSMPRYEVLNRVHEAGMFTLNLQTLAKPECQCEFDRQRMEMFGQMSVCGFKMTATSSAFKPDGTQELRWTFVRNF